MMWDRSEATTIDQALSRTLKSSAGSRLSDAGLSLTLINSTENAEVHTLKKHILVALTSLLPSFSAWGYHPAADIVDPDIYTMIDSLVADTPHADLVFIDQS